MKKQVGRRISSKTMVMERWKRIQMNCGYFVGLQNWIFYTKWLCYFIVQAFIQLHGVLDSQKLINV